MAIKPTIYKFNISLSDINRSVFESIQLTVALHPSETLHRMLARVVAYCCEYEQGLSFTKGLSEVEEPDIWIKSLDDKITLWIDIGEPSVERVKKASRLATTTKIYSFNTKAEVWWQLNQAKIDKRVQVNRLDWQGIESFVELIERTTNMSLTITDQSAYVATEKGECEVSWFSLSDN